MRVASGVDQLIVKCCTYFLQTYSKLRKFDLHTSHNDFYFRAEEVYANVKSQMEVVMNTTILSYYMLMGARRNTGEWTYILMVGIFV